MHRKTIIQSNNYVVANVSCFVENVVVIVLKAVYSKQHLIKKPNKQ